MNKLFLMSQITHDIGINFGLICEHTKKQKLRSQWFCSRYLFVIVIQIQIGWFNDKQGFDNPCLKILDNLMSF